MAKLDETEDIDALIDRAVDTFFVEEPGPDERAAWESSQEKEAPVPSTKAKTPAGGAEPSLEEAVDSLFMSAFQEEPSQEADFATPQVRPSSVRRPSPTPDFSPPPAGRSTGRRAQEPLPDFGTSTVITSGDPDTDREIDIAVDTLFVEEPDTPAPETTQLEVTPTEPFEPPQRPPRSVPANHRAEQMLRSATEKPHVAAPRRPLPPVAEGPNYDEAMAQEIQRHMHTLYKEASHEQAAPAKRPTVSKPAPRKAPAPKTADVFPLRQLQEAILTLEWEISRRSVTVLANELRKVRISFKDNVTVDFAALSMRVVLDYVVKRMSRAHPESIRFLLDVTDYLGKSIDASSTDPLTAFHYILTRYEKYKSAVRRAEGIPDRKPQIMNELSIKDPGAFVEIVRIQTLALKRAGESLADRMHSAPDPEYLIRSFRFLVNRVVNRILESTREGQVAKPVQHKTRK